MINNADDKLILPNEVLFAEVEKCLHLGRQVILPAKGNSMFPFIMGGRDSVVLVKPVTAALQVGDIVLVRMPGGMYIMHRIVSIRSDELVLMGDGNVRGREHCKPADVVGLVKTILRGGCPVDSHARWENIKVVCWQRLLPLRRYLLFLLRIIYKKMK